MLGFNKSVSCSPLNHDGSGRGNEPPIARGIIEVQLRDLSQLFDSLDPSPFRNRDLSPAAEEYLVESVKEMTTAAPCALVVHLDTSTEIPLPCS